MRDFDQEIDRAVLKSKMIKKLMAGELDVAICVTEGLVAGIVSVKSDAKYCTVDDLEFGATFGISREGSGSQIMAEFAASRYSWKNKPQFKILGDVTSLVKGVKGGEVDAFLWERTTMNRYYDRGDVRYLGTVKAPWPAFSFGACKEYVENNAELLVKMLDCINRAVGHFLDETNDRIRGEFIQSVLGYSAADHEQWLGYVKYGNMREVDLHKIGYAAKVLQQAGVMPSCDADDMVLMPAQDAGV
ncbi:hypothetical protein GGI02_002009 [Coemansia sp. RSA 2322]|nr:hypothetical protein GGI02_002009 [Coemansia sp. RSA 2322]